MTPYSTLSEFTASRKAETSVIGYADDGSDIVGPVLSYGNGMCCIQIIGNDRYYLQLERDEWVGDLDELEPILFRWYQSEF